MTKRLMENYIILHTFAMFFLSLSSLSVLFGFWCRFLSNIHFRIFVYNFRDVKFKFLFFLLLLLLQPMWVYIVGQGKWADFMKVNITDTNNKKPLEISVGQCTFQTKISSFAFSVFLIKKIRTLLIELHRTAFI